MAKFYLDALGCKVNSYEASLLRGPLEAMGHTETGDPKEADYIFLNACAVTARSVQKGRQRIRKLRRLAPKARLLVSGCFVAAAPGLAKELGADDEIATYGRNEALSRLLGLPLEKAAPYRREAYEEPENPSEQKDLRAYLKVQDGCSRFCSYCLIPYLRGPSRSRDPEHALREAEILSQTHPEIVVTGIEVAFYGRDLGDGSYRLSSLLSDILKRCPDLKRLRLSSLEEGAIDEKMLELFAHEPRLASHVHLALQAGSDHVLSLMGRPYDRAKFLAVANRLKAARPGIALTTDVIVGFPGETEEDFEDTLDLCRAVGFAEMHVFPYSSRPGTKATRMKEKEVPFAVKKEREKRLLALSKELRADFEKRNYGAEKEIILEECEAKSGCWLGHSSDYLLIKASGAGLKRGDVVKVIYSPENRAD